MSKKKDLCHCKICGKTFDYGGIESPMLLEDKWKKVIQFYDLVEVEKEAAKKCRINSRLDNNKCHVFICSDCMEKALGHKLTAEDINRSLFNMLFIEEVLGIDYDEFKENTII